MKRFLKALEAGRVTLRTRDGFELSISGTAAIIVCALAIIALVVIQPVF